MQDNEITRLMQAHVKINTQIPISDMVTDLDETDTLLLIRALDRSQMSSDFTIEVIKALFESLKGDMIRSQMVQLAKELKKSAKEMENE